MKKILFLINTLTGGGAEKVLVDLVNNLNTTEYDVTVQTIQDIGIYKNQLNKNIKYKSIISGQNPFLSRLQSHILTHLLPGKMVYNFFIKDNYNVEVAFLEGVPTKILSASPNKNKLAWVHTDLYNYYGHKKIFRTVEENADCYKKFKKIICVSQTAKEGFKKRFGFEENVIVKYNPVDEKNILIKSEENINEIRLNDKFRIITVGRLVYQKGYDRLLRVHKKLMDDGFDYELLILGEGEERRKLEAYIAENNLEDSVILLGFQNNPYKFMKHADLFVCSSRAEGFSTVVTESTILGIPTITTECSGMKELFGDSEYGVVVDNNERNLYDGMKRLLANKELLHNYRHKALERGFSLKIESRMREIEDLLM